LGKEDSAIIEKVMLQLVNHNFPLGELKNNANDFVKAKGNFPFGELVILHYKMFGGQFKEIYYAAAAVELIILSLDIFDDLQDEDDFTMPWNNIDPSISMNIATGLLVLSTKSLEETSFDVARKLTAINYLNTLVLQAVKGQHADLSNLIESIEDYIEMVKNKSGSLVATACLVGTSLATEKHHETVKKYAEHMGIVAQIKNDIKDIVRLDRKNDLVNKKRTITTLFLLNNQQQQLQFIREYFKGKLHKNELLQNKEEIQELISKSGALDYASVFIRLYQLQVIEILEGMWIAQEWKDRLLNYI
jgi:competence protein ComQ